MRDIRDIQQRMEYEDKDKYSIRRVWGTVAE